MKPYMLLFLLQCTLLSATSIEDLVSEQFTSELYQNGKSTQIQLKDPRPLLVPDSELTKNTVQSVFNELEPSILVETIYLYEKPMENRGRSWTNSEYVSLYNAVRALSTLSGIEYFSASRNKMRTFYELSTLIDDPESKKVLPDPIVSIPAATSKLYARQKDLTFGDNIYTYDFYTANSEIIFIQENLTTMSYGIIPILRKNRLRTVVSITDTEKYLLVYAASMARAVMLPGIEGKVRDSFSNRSDAVYDWFSSQADAAFAKALE